MPDYYREQRPWGEFTILYETPAYKVKEVLVRPNCRLSYQFHKQRSEHWVIVKGTATVTLDDRELVLEENQSIDVPKGAKHRIANRSNGDLVFIEVQKGDYFGEDDIVRLEDDYNRVS